MKVLLIYGTAQMEVVVPGVVNVLNSYHQTKVQRATDTGNPYCVASYTKRVFRRDLDIHSRYVYWSLNGR